MAAPTVSRIPASGGPGHAQAISRSKWEEEMNKVSLSKSDLNSLVFEYLIIEGFSDAAVEFARETGLPHDIDHAAIQERMEIRDAVIEGRIEEAVRRVNELDPEILDTNPPLLFHLHLLRLIEFIRLEQLDEALDFATNELAPRGAQNPEFLGDLERTMALLAFPDLARFADDSLQSGDSVSGRPPPETATLDLFQDAAFTPIIALMRRSQRVRVAGELNSAILESQGQGMETRLRTLVRLMMNAEEKLEQFGITLPGDEKDKGRQWANGIFNPEAPDS